MQVTLDSATHTYTLDDGTKLPSVSEIISPLGPDFDAIPEMELVIDAAAEPGTVLHKVFELLLSSETDVDCPDAYAGYIAAIRLFLAEHTIVPLAVEQPMYSPTMGVAGTPDLLCEMDDALTLIDYKFVAQMAKTRVKAQLNAYRLMYEEQGVMPDKLLAVQFLPNGLYCLYPVAQDTTEWELCLALHRLKNKKHPKGAIE